MLKYALFATLGALGLVGMGLLGAKILGYGMPDMFSMGLTNLARSFYTGMGILLAGIVGVVVLVGAIAFVVGYAGEAGGSYSAGRNFEPEIDIPSELRLCPKFTIAAEAAVGEAAALENGPLHAPQTQTHRLRF